MRFSLVLAATLLLVGAGCDDVSKLNNESNETKPEVQETSQTETSEVTKNTEVNTSEDSKKLENEDKDDGDKNDDREENDDDKKTVTTQPTVKPTETKPVVTAPTEPAGPKTYTMAEVQAAAAAGKCWTVVNGGVYDLSAWISKHPGGSAAIKSLCGINGTAKFQATHGGQPKPENTLKSYYLGALK